MRRGRIPIVLLLALAFGSVGASVRAQNAPVDVPNVSVPGRTDTGPQAAQADRELVGLFGVRAGSCEGSVAGSYFRMIQPGGTVAGGPYVSNGDSPCSDDTYTPLRPGSDGGLATGGYQPNPDPAFDGSGNGLAARITKPQGFFSVRFATATNATDPQTDAKVPAPRIYSDGGKLSGDVRAFAAAWNRQHFNQGSPKPDGTKPGNTAGPSGTLDPASGAYTLEWSSQIVGGPFNNFTGLWHLTGIFKSGVKPAGSSDDTSVSAGTTVAPAAREVATSPSGEPLAVTGGGVSTTVGSIAAVLGSAPFLVRFVHFVRRRRTRR